MAKPTALYKVDPDGVAVITLSNPPVNALHPDGTSHAHALGPQAYIAAAAS